MEAIYEFEVEDMPVTVAVDSTGANAHQIGPDTWKVKIQEMESQAWSLWEMAELHSKYLMKVRQRPRLFLYTVLCIEELQEHSCLDLFKSYS